MPASVPRRALIAVTSAHAQLYPNGGETGVFITEALHPFEGFRKAGFECHGGAILPGVKDQSGKSIISGRKVTGFTDKGEEELGALAEIKNWNRSTIQESAASAGAEYVNPPSPWAAYQVTDGRLVTGVNPQSATVTTEAAIKAFDAL